MRGKRKSHYVSREIVQYTLTSQPLFLTFVNPINARYLTVYMGYLSTKKIKNKKQSIWFDEQIKKSEINRRIISKQLAEADETNSSFCVYQLKERKQSKNYLYTFESPINESNMASVAKVAAKGIIPPVISFPQQAMSGSQWIRSTAVCEKKYHNQINEENKMQFFL